jgi:hypothetical protein
MDLILRHFRTYPDIRTSKLQNYYVVLSCRVADEDQVTLLRKSHYNDLAFYSLLLCCLSFAYPFDLYVLVSI